MVFIVYLVQLLLGLDIGAVADSINKPSLSEVTRMIIVVVFMLGTTTVISSSCLITGYEAILKQGE